MSNHSKTEVGPAYDEDGDPRRPGTASDEPDYEVGYGKPPVGRRFKPGRSGNPKGRPKGDQNFRTLFELELSERVPVKEQGRRRKMTRRRVIVKRSVSEAMAGNPKHLAIVLAHDALSARVLEEVSGALSRPVDDVVKRDLILRLRAAVAEAAPTGELKLEEGE
jgi:hypothetical protein